MSQCYSKKREKRWNYRKIKYVMTNTLPWLLLNKKSIFLLHSFGNNSNIFLFLRSFIHFSSFIREFWFKYRNLEFIYSQLFDQMLVEFTKFDLDLILYMLRWITNWVIGLHSIWKENNKKPLRLASSTKERFYVRHFGRKQNLISGSDL